MIENTLSSGEAALTWFRKLGRRVRSDPLITFGTAVLLAFGLIAVFGDFIAPYDPYERFHRDGTLMRLENPSRDHWFGTTYYGADVFSQVIIGTRVSAIVGLSAAVFATFIGTTIGLTSGYFGGRIDDILMRLTDIAYGIPMLGFAIVVIALTEPSLWAIIIAISLLLWRTTARSIRSQVLSIKQRPFVWGATVAGASHFRIMFKHILPNIVSLAMLYAAIAVGSAILWESGLSFLGLGDPLNISWGQMLYYAFITGAIRHAWWWVVPPGICISLFILASYLIGRAYEQNQE